MAKPVFEPRAGELLEAVPAPLFVIGPDGMIASSNAAADALFGTTLAGRHFTAALRSPAATQAINDALANETRASVPFEKRSGAKTRHLLMNVAPLSGGGALVALADETLAHDVNELRSEFVANVSHELRTPLTALAGMIETLQGPARDDAKAREQFLELMGREAARMNRLVQDLLSLSRVESGAPAEKHPLDLCAVINAAISSLSHHAEARGTRVDLKGCDQPVLVGANADQMRQIFNNLIENAIKYGRENGEVTIVVTAVDFEPLLGSACIRIEVQDQGEGIAQEHIARLTERFYRVDKHRSRDTGGTGLGLAIVKHIILQHGGRLRISSEQGVGSCFSVLLPLR